MEISVIYHKKCPDGLSGAWVAWKKFGDKAEYIPIENRSEFPGIENKEVYIFDLGFIEPVLKEIKEKNKKVIVIDHHETVTDFTGNIADEYHYDNKVSACIIAWKYFFPGKPVPKLLEYVSDTDTWTFELPHSKEILMMANLVGFGDVEKWNAFINDIEDEETRNKNIELGKVILEYEDKLIEAIAEFAYEVEFEEMKVLAVNNSRPLRSPLGHFLAHKKPPMGIIWYEVEDGIHVSLRSDGSVDVAEIAKKYGGGGHPAAAGFFIPKGENIPWKTL